MTNNLKLSLACGDYDHTRALWDGRANPEGIDLTYIPLPPAEIFWRMLRYNEFDTSEMSLSNYLTEICQENPRFIAIPVFPSRMFRHAYIFINNKSGIKAPEDLKQKRVGIAQYTMTATVWIRGLLQHDYGVAPSDMEWYVGGQEGLGRQGKMKSDVPKNLPFHQVPVEKALSDMLVNGEIDVIITPFAPRCFSEKHPDVDRLWPDYREVEMDYYRRTKIFPIMHTIVIKRQLYEAQPWVAQSLYKSFVEAKELCQDAIRFNRGSSTYMLPWATKEYETTVALMGEDFWPYGVEANRVTLEAITQYSYEQGLSSRRLSVEELFAASTQIVQVQKMIHK
ncbi:ABC transporter substrate-binding protein [Chloroflexota bacterium]